MLRRGATLKGLNLAKIAKATPENLLKVFTFPEDPHSTLAQIEDEISKNMHGFLNDHVVAGDANPSEIESDFKSSVVPEEPVWVSDQADFLLQKVVSQSVHTSSPKFIGHMTSALPYFMLPLSKLMAALNQNVVKIETSKVFTPMERQVIAMLHRSFYAQDDKFYTKYAHHREFSLGSFCSGGTIGNITALWAARNKLLGPKADFKGIQQEGLLKAVQAHGYKDLAIVVSELSHYSLRKSVDMLGIGHKNLVKIPCDDNFRIKTDALQKTMAELKEKRVGVIAMVGVCGTTETGSVDDMAAMHEVAKEFQCHLHIDAAWGGPTIFSDAYAKKLKGIELADSITIDAHKQMYVPVGAGIVLFKNPDIQSSIQHNANYVIRKGSRDLGKMTVEGSRPGVSMLVHSAIHVFGRKGFQLLIDSGIERAQKFASLINEDECFELISEPELNILTYRFIPPHLMQKIENSDQKTRAKINSFLNELTVSIQKRQRSDGNSFVSRTTLKPTKYDRQEIVVFRSVLANPLTTHEMLSEILTEQAKLASEIMETEFAEESRALESL